MSTTQEEPTNRHVISVNPVQPQKKTTAEHYAERKAKAMRVFGTRALLRQKHPLTCLVEITQCTKMVTVPPSHYAMASLYPADRRVHNANGWYAKLVNAPAKNRMFEVFLFNDTYFLAEDLRTRGDKPVRTINRADAIVKGNIPWE